MKSIVAVLAEEQQCEEKQINKKNMLRMKGIAEEINDGFQRLSKFKELKGKRIGRSTVVFNL